MITVCCNLSLSLEQGLRTRPCVTATCSVQADNGLVETWAILRVLKQRRVSAGLL